MKKLFLLSVLLLLFCAFKSKAQSSITSHSDFPDGLYGGIYGGHAPESTIENDSVTPNPPSGWTTVGVYLVVWLHGDQGDDLYPIIDGTSGGPINDDWDYTITDPYPGENFTLTYSWECDYFDGTNYASCWQTIVE